MEKIDLVLWFMGAGFSVMFTMMLMMWSSINTRIDKLDEKVTDIDRRLCRLEGAFSSKECCMIKDSSHMKKAE